MGKTIRNKSKKQKKELKRNRRMRTLKRTFQDEKNTKDKMG
jgi:hypothetical protein